MPIFISYSHRDSWFVDVLARQLVRHHVNVWLDRWELSIGDSIVEKVQEAIDESSALLVVLSTASADSEWCKRELTGGLLKELEDRRIFVMPILLEDCAIPVFARDKLYADFRTSFDEGLSVVLEGIAKITNPNLGRAREPEVYTDWALDWTTTNDELVMRLTFVQQAKDQPYSCLAIIKIIVEGEAIAVYRSHANLDDDGSLARFRVIESLQEHLKQSEILRMVLSDQFECSNTIQFNGRLGEPYAALITARRLGEDTGRNVILSINGFVDIMYLHEKEVLRVRD